MPPKTPVVSTRLAPPRLHKRILLRPRLTSLLLGALDYRLTILQAGAGYGKTTALAALKDCGYPFSWYHLGSEDADPYVFFLHLFQSLRMAQPDLPEDALALLESEELNPKDLPWSEIVEAFVNDLAEKIHSPALVVLDDVHTLNEAADVLRILDRLVDRAPADLHFLISSRTPVRLPGLVAWRAKGEVLFVGQEDLAFTVEEIASLFRERYAISLTDEDIRSLAAETEGWAIALQLYGQGLKSGAVVSPAGRRPFPPGTGAEGLFDYLAQEVFAQLSPDVRQFLQVTAVLRELNVSICNQLRSENDSDQYLRYLYEHGLFLVDLGGESIRYHHLFREFILRRLPDAERRELNRKAAVLELERNQEEDAIYHFLRAGAFPEAAAVMVDLGETLVRAGRLETLNKWIAALPPDVLHGFPQLMVYLGDIARLRSRFDEAMGWYRQAEERSRGLGEMRGASLALHGQARVYLDTVNPSQAEKVLQEALRIADGTEDRENRARLLELIAENRLNLGRLDEAERYRDQARQLREMGPAEMELSVRVLLRTGKLEQARLILEERVQEERRAPILRPRAHRETLLLLSLILAFEGQAEAALAFASEGTERGKLLDSPFITAVGLMRQGHARLLRRTPQDYEEACRCYQEAISIADRLEVPRLKVEAMWGICRAHGFRGQVEDAERAAQEGLSLGRQAGDEWISALILVSMGGGYALAGRYPEALESLDQARAQFIQVSDSFGECVARLWQCLVWWKTGEKNRLERSLDDLLRLVSQFGYGFLFTQCSLIGPPEVRQLVPLLLLARGQTRHKAFVESLLARLGLAGIEYHPGYQLRVQALGPFRVWRDEEEISPGEWRRENARQLFQVLLTFRRTPLERDRLIEILWPDMEVESGIRNLKVALSTLFRVLDPGQTRDNPSAFIARDGSLYCLRQAADLRLDVDQFEKLVEEGDRLPDREIEHKTDCYQEALKLYQGDYLQDNPYADWCSEERERLLDTYLRTANRLAHLLSARRQWEDVLAVSHAILAHDACWEEAYRLLMTAYIELGNRAQALRAYQRCLDKLESELGTKPSLTTLRLYEELFPGQ